MIAATNTGKISGSRCLRSLIGGNEMRYTEYHAGVAVIKDKALLKEAMQKLAKLEDLEEQRRLLVVEYNLSENRRKEE